MTPATSGYPRLYAGGVPKVVEQADLSASSAPEYGVKMQDVQGKVPGNAETADTQVLQ